MSKEKRNLKKKKKQKEKRNKQLKDILQWMDIQKICDEGIFLKKDSSEMIAKGFRVEPFNILLAESIHKARAIIALASGLDICKFTIYYKFIKSEPRLTYQLSQLSEDLKLEKNVGIRNLIQMEADKMEWFCETHTEVAFYIMVQDDKLHVDKKLEQIKQIFVQIGMNPKMMTISDYESVVKEQFENETVNEYMFSVLMNDKELYENVKFDEK